MVEPINEQLSDDFHVGGRDREMPPELQLEQLVSYIEATYDPSSCLLYTSDAADE